MARIGIIGAGVVGQATGIGFSHFGHEVIFYDIKPETVMSLQSRGYTAFHPSEASLQQTDATIVSVSTPTINGDIDLSYIEAACETMAQIVSSSRRYQLLIIRSTLPPGTTQEFIIPRIEAWSGRKAITDFGIGYNPEFLREKSALSDFEKPWIVVFGANDERSSAAIRQLYHHVVLRTKAPLFETNIRASEMVKYASNLYNASKISFTNEIWHACRVLGIDGNMVMNIVSRSAEGMWNPEYGTKGGYPYGGNCLPKDTMAFESYARSKGLNMHLLRAVIGVNESMAEMAGSLSSESIEKATVSTKIEANVLSADN